MNSFSLLCASLRSVSSHKEKSSMINDYLKAVKESKRVYNVKDKQLINYFAQLFSEDKDEMLAHLGSAEDVATTISKYFEMNLEVKPRKTSTLSLEEVNQFLDSFANSYKDTSRLDLLISITKKSTVDDLITIIRLLRNDLRINAGSKQVLDGLHPEAYAAFQTCRYLKAVVEKVLALSETCTPSISGGGRMKTVAKAAGLGGKPALPRGLSARIQLMTPIKPMLAEACRSAAQALASLCSDGGDNGAKDHGIMAEIKYDGERVQLHKKGNRFAYFSRSLKAVPPSKVSHVERFIPQAFNKADELIIDGEILLLDAETNKPLPFGSLGVHKVSLNTILPANYSDASPTSVAQIVRMAFKNATVCIFVFDCLYLNGESLIDWPVYKRRKVLEQQMQEVEHRVLFSEVHFVKSTYEPGKRRWLKIKRDYLAEGSLADSVDLIVLGAYFGTGSKAGLASVFLMGAYDQQTKRFATVTKCGNGFTDDLLNRLQKQLNLIKISRDCKQVPSWLDVSKTLVPDFVVKDPKTAPVWEITGAEFSRSSTHTASLGRPYAPSNVETDQPQQGISIRFPRMTRERPDKSWREATSVDQLEVLVAKSGQRSDWLDVLNDASSSSSIVAGQPRKRSAAKSSQQKAESRAKKAHFEVGQHVIVELDDRLEADDDQVIMQLIRQLIANGAQLAGRVPTKFTTFTNLSDPVTFRLVSADQPSSSQTTTIPVLTITEVKEAIRQKRALWN